MRANRLLSIVAFILGIIFCSAEVIAQTNDKPKKQFLTFYFDMSTTKPTRFRQFPLEQLVGVKLGRDWENGGYHSKDDSIRINGVKFSKRTKGAGLIVYPFSNGNGVRLALKADYETMPTIKFAINSPSGIENYLFTNARVYNMGLGLRVTDRDTGWGLGAHSFIFGGIGKIYEPRGRGKRVFTEFGGGVNIGPFGLDLSIEFNWNRLNNPRSHNFMTVPISLRTTFSF